jgi:transposase
VRDPATTTFTGAIEEAAAFGRRIYADAVRRGLFKAKRVVVLADGAEWIKNLVATHFPMAIRIIDFYHAKEHVATLCKALFTKPESVLRYRDRWWEMLAEGRVEALIAQAEAFVPSNRTGNNDARREIQYLRKNMDQMRYRQFRDAGYFIGSGLIEAALPKADKLQTHHRKTPKTIRHGLPALGMEWTVEGANAIIALRCATQSSRFTDYWENRAA